VFTPVFTLGLGAVPMHLYSHGSSILGTLQQVAAAFGTALVVTVMTARANSLADGGSGAADALLGGMQWAFAVGAGISLLIVVFAVVLPGRLPAPVVEPGSESELSPSSAS
jgi:DHA2 family lincomycin resistance protein-like MFS transporter